MDQIRRTGEPDGMVFAVGKKRAFQTDIFPVDLFRKENHIPVFRQGDGFDVKVTEIFCDSDPATDTGIAVDGKTNAVLTVTEISDSGIVNTADPITGKRKHTFGDNFPIHSVFAVCGTEIGFRGRVIRDPGIKIGKILFTKTIIVPEEHHIAVTVTADSCVKSQRTVIRDLFPGKNDPFPSYKIRCFIRINTHIKSFLQ